MGDKIDSAAATHAETEGLPQPMHKPKFSSKTKGQDGDIALTLFNNLDELDEPIDPLAEQRLVRKIDLIILPLIVVNYMFFYIDKTTLSYAAIFGVTEDLHLHGKQYSWLSSTSQSVLMLNIHD